MNFLTQKLAGINKIDLVESGFLPPIQESILCRYEPLCLDIKKLNKSYEEGIPNQDLLDKYEELCSHPVEGVRRISCKEFRRFEGVVTVLEKESEGIREYYGQNIKGVIKK